jgi:hypothetical protein
MKIEHSPILRPLHAQLAARVSEDAPLSLEELRELTIAIGVAADRYEGVVLAFRPGARRVPIREGAPE